MTLTGADVRLHAAAATTTCAMALAILIGSQRDCNTAMPSTPPAQMQVIEAGLAIKASNHKQPQKPAAHTEAAQPTPTPSMQPAATPAPPDNPSHAKNYDKEFQNLRRSRSEGEGTTTGETGGAFDGSEFGDLEQATGDPYARKLKEDLLAAWEYPEILSDQGEPYGCIHLRPSGEIADVTIKEPSGNVELNDSAERALAKLKQKRNDRPVPVPGHLQALTQNWICFRFRASAKPGAS